jgi:hypothetical protein
MPGPKLSAADGATASLEAGATLPAVECSGTVCVICTPLNVIRFALESRLATTRRC